MMKVKEWLENKKKPNKMLWTPELAEDLHNFHSIDAEAELVKLLNQEIAKETLKQMVGKENFERVLGKDF